MKTLAKPIIQMKDVTFTYPGAENPILKKVDLTIYEHEFVAIIGGNGSGKSTLCKTFNGLIPQFYVGDFEGDVWLTDFHTAEHSVGELSKHIGYVYQDFENQIMRPTVLDDVSFVPLNYGLKDYKERGLWALEVTGLSSIANEYIWQLSGGQKHLLAIAGVLAMKPRILIVDEPVAQLDPQHAEEVYRVLKKLNEELGMTIIVIEHHTEFIADYCHRVILMDQGSIQWTKPTKQALSSIKDLIARQIYPPQVTQAAYQMDQKNIKNLPINLEEGMQYFINLMKKEKRNQQVITSLFPKIERLPLISFQNVSLEFKDFRKQIKQVLTNIHTSIYEGERIAIVGNNGAGKSSLIKLITGITKPTRGEIQICHLQASRSTPEKLSQHVAYVYQNPEEMFIEDSVRKEIELFLKSRKVENYPEKVEQILKDFSLEKIQHDDARLLSGGQKRRVSLAIGAAMRPEIMLLDEPTANLDIATKRHVIQMLNSLKEHVKTVMIASHDMQLVSEWATRILVMHEGKVIGDGTREEIFSNPSLLEKAGLVMPQIMKLSQKMNLETLSYTIEDFCENFICLESDGVKHEYV